MSKLRYVTHETCPECPEGEVWVNSSLSEAERGEVLAEMGMESSIVYQSEAKVEREPSADLERYTRITELVGELTQPPDEPRRTIVNVAAPVVSYQCPEFPVRELADALSESLVEALAESQAEAISAVLRPLVDAMKDLAAAVLAAKPPRVEVFMPPPNPTPVSMTLPVEEKKKRSKKKFTKNAEGEIDGVEDVD